MRYRILVEDRKDVVNAMEAATGEKPEYTRMPRCAYILRGIAVEKTGFVTAEEDADLELIGHLIGAGLIKRVRESAAQETSSEVTETAEAEETAETREVPEIEEEISAEDEEASEETVTENAEQEATEEEASSEEDPAEETAEETEETETGEGDDTEADGDSEDEEDAEDDMSCMEEEVASAAACYANLVPADPQALKPDISFPLERLRAESICNLIFTIAARGSLISKATKGHFGVSEELVEALQSGRVTTKENALEIIRGAGEEALAGLSFKEDKVVFTGFPQTDDPDEIRAWMALAAAINRACIRQTHVRAKKVDETNEKFAFRTWLIRLGMNGPDTKAERNILYRHLSGHTAFRTPADEAKWKARQAAKRAELRAARMAESEENGAEA